MSFARQLRYYRLRAALAPEGSPARAQWREKKRRLQHLLAHRANAAEWDRRIADVLACPDLAALPRCAGAGEISGGEQLLHNGRRVAVGSYYSRHMHRLLRRARGVHEPQEERVFAAVLPELPAGACMFEFGAYWAHYSMWFQQAVRDARNFLVEPVAANLNAGRLNFALNGCAGEFLQGYAGARFHPHPHDAPTVSADWLARTRGVARVHLLHSDIQGAELDMLAGAENLARERRLDYIFLSTHSAALHAACRAWLTDRNFHIFAEHTLAESYSVDGLLAARRAELPGPAAMAVVRKPAAPAA